MSVASILAVYNGQEPDLCFGGAPGPGGVNSVNVGTGLVKTGSSANPVVNLGMSAVGDLLVGNGVANSGIVLSKGANGEFLRVKNDGTGLEYAAVAPGGVDSVSAAVNNVGLVLTAPLPASPADPKIGLAFTAKADVPVGTAANTGVMVSAPLPLTTGLVLQTDTGEPSGVKWAPAAGPTGVITTNAPLKDDYSAGTNKISIDFTDKVFGEIPYGDGTAETGALLAPPTDSSAVGKVLTYTGIVQGQPAIGWVSPASPAGGDTIIYHSSAPSVAIDAPKDTNEQLVLVAENVGFGSWDGNAEYGQDLELWMEQIPSQGPPLSYMAKAVATGPTGRHVDILNISLGGPEYIGTLSYVYEDGTGDNAVVNCYTYGRTTAGNIFEAAGGVFSGGLVIGGRFNRWLPSGATTPTILANICLLTNTGASGGTIIQLPCSNNDPATQSYPGLINNTGANDEKQQVCSITCYDGGANTILGAVPGFIITGEFDTLELLQGSTIVSDKGLVNIAVYQLNVGSNFSFLSVANTLNLGFALGGSLPNAQGGVLGQVRCSCFNLPAYSIIYFGGDGLTTAIASGDPAGATSYALPANCAGFAVYDYTNSPPAVPVNNWGVNAIPAVTPTFQTAGLYAIAPSVTLTNEIIALGDQSFLVNKTNPISFVYTQLGVPNTTPICPSWPSTGVYGFFNSIYDTDFDTAGGGQLVGDCCVFSTAKTPGSNGEQYACYFSTAGGTTPVNIAPSPCGPLSPLIAGEQCRFGMYANDPIQNPPPTQPIIGGTSAPGGFYLYDPVSHPQIEFVNTPPCVFRPPAGGTFTKAQFTTSYQSQSFVSSSDRTAWIQLGPANAAVAYAN